MVVVGVILILLVLLVASVPNWLLWLGIVLVVVGLVLNLVPIGAAGERKPIRRVY